MVCWIEDAIIVRSGDDDTAKIFSRSLISYYEDASSSFIEVNEKKCQYLFFIGSQTRDQKGYIFRLIHTKKNYSYRDIMYQT